MLKLGKLPATRDARDYKLTLLQESVGLMLPKPPSRFGHGSMFKDWKMLANGPDDTVFRGFQGAGDCVFAGGAHETMETNKLAGHTVVFSGHDVIGDYSAVTGYIVGNDSTDNGTDVRVAMKYRKATGLIDSAGQRHKIAAYLSIDAQNFDVLMEAAYIFSAVGIGFNFPDTAMDQFNHNEPWDVVHGAAIEGGHYVPVFGRSSVGVAGVVSWGKRIGMTRAFYETYNDETWAMIYPEELKNGKTERGFDLTQLIQALEQL